MKRSADSSSSDGSASRDARRKAALRANLARRKAQARSRADEMRAEAADGWTADDHNTAPETAPRQEPSED